MVGREAAGAAARRDPGGGTPQAAEQREPAPAVRREGQRRRTLDREADGRRHSHWHGSTSELLDCLYFVILKHI